MSENEDENEVNTGYVLDTEQEQEEEEEYVPTNLPINEERKKQRNQPTRDIYFANNKYTIQGNDELNVNHIESVSMDGYFDTTYVTDDNILLNLKMKTTKKFNDKNKQWYSNVAFQKYYPEENDIYTFFGKPLKSHDRFTIKTPFNLNKTLINWGGRRKTKKYKRKNIKNKSKKKLFL